MTISKDRSLLESEIDLFFFHNKKELELHYAGINANYLKRFFFNKSYSDFYSLKDRILLGIPLPYLNQRHFFYENQFFVNDCVLIPRNETELLVERALEIIDKERDKENRAIRIIDIGCGSGCIGLSLLANSARVINLVLSDISKDVLAVTQKNYEKLSYNFKKGQDISFIQSDRLNGIEGLFDLIVSNPPYIKRDSHRSLVHQKAHEHEPHLALYLDDSLYDKWFDDFFKEIKEHSHSDTTVLLEFESVF